MDLPYERNVPARPIMAAQQDVSRVAHRTNRVLTEIAGRMSVEGQEEEGSGSRIVSCTADMTV
jgi:hypothetical protein